MLHVPRNLTITPFPHDIVNSLIGRLTQFAGIRSLRKFTREQLDSQDFAFFEVPVKKKIINARSSPNGWRGKKKRSFSLF